MFLLLLVKHILPIYLTHTPLYEGIHIIFFSLKSRHGIPGLCGFCFKAPQKLLAYLVLASFLKKYSNHFKINDIFKTLLFLLLWAHWGNPTEGNRYGLWLIWKPQFIPPVLKTEGTASISLKSTGALPIWAHHMLQFQINVILKFQCAHLWNEYWTLK